MRDPSGRSLHDRDTGVASETRQMGESERQLEGRAAPYVVVVAAIFIVIAVLLIVLR